MGLGLRTYLAAALLASGCAEKEPLPERPQTTASPLAQDEASRRKKEVEGRVGEVLRLQIDQLPEEIGAAAGVGASDQDHDHQPQQRSPEDPDARPNRVSEIEFEKAKQWKFRPGISPGEGEAFCGEAEALELELCSFKLSDAERKKLMKYLDKVSELLEPYGIRLGTEKYWKEELRRQWEEASNPMEQRYEELLAGDEEPEASELDEILKAIESARLEYRNSLFREVLRFKDESRLHIIELFDSNGEFYGAVRFASNGATQFYVSRSDSRGYVPIPFKDSPEATARKILKKLGLLSE